MAQAMCQACCWLHCYHAPTSCLMQAHSQRSHRLQAPPPQLSDACSTLAVLPPVCPPSCLMRTHYQRLYRLWVQSIPNPSSTIIRAHVTIFCSGLWPSFHQVVGCQLT